MHWLFLLETGNLNFPEYFKASSTTKFQYLSVKFHKKDWFCHSLFWTRSKLFRTRNKLISGQCSNFIHPESTKPRLMCTYLEFFKTKLTTHFNILSSSVAVNSRNINFISVKKSHSGEKKSFLNQFQLPISPLLRLKGMAHKSVRKQWLFKSFFQHHSIIAKKKNISGKRHRPYPLLELQCTSTIKSRIWVQFGLDYLLDYVNDSKNSETGNFWDTFLRQ